MGTSLRGPSPTSIDYDVITANTERNPDLMKTTVLRFEKLAISGFVNTSIGILERLLHGLLPLALSLLVLLGKLKKSEGLNSLRWVN